MFATEFNHCSGPSDAEARLHGTRFVVDARVNYTAIVSALMASNAFFLFQEQQAQLGKAAADFEGDT
jgi:hypothetical protein